MMQPHLAPAIEAQTRREFPDGIAGYGTDALRFTFASIASGGRDASFDLKRVEGYRNFCNKLWNATRFVLMNAEGLEPAAAPPLDARGTLDRWIVSRLQQTEATVTARFADYRFDLAATAIYEFVWNEYCDWYLELAKPVLNGEDAVAREATRHTLVRVLEATLRLAHPIMPFITEELWQAVAPLAGERGETISRQSWPAPDEACIDEAALAEIDWVKQCILGVRRIRSEMDINPGRRLPLHVDGASDEERRLLGEHEALLRSVARLDGVSVLGPDDTRPESAVALVGDMQLLIPMAGVIDKDAELARLGRETARLEKETSRLEAKLGNAGFTAKAPAAVVDAERAKLDEARAALERLREQTVRIAAL